MSTAENWIKLEGQLVEQGAAVSEFRLRLREQSAFPVPSGWDYVDVPIADAYNLFYNLENLEFVSTGTKSTANINWTWTLGATESLPFTASTNSRSGAYYAGAAGVTSTPAGAPKFRTGPYQSAILAQHTGTSFRFISLELRPSGYVTENSTTRIAYLFRMSEGSIGGLLGTFGIGVFSPTFANNFFTGTPPSTGTFDILGITFSWAGGGWTNNPATWASETATLSATSSAFTY